MVRLERLYARLTKGLDSISKGNRFGQVQGYGYDDEQKKIMLELVDLAMKKIGRQTPLGSAILGMWERAILPRAIDNNTLQSDEENCTQEQCELCDALIDFESTAEARCRSGHQFSEYF